MNKNEAVNFGKQYRSTICLDGGLHLVKLLDYVPEESQYVVLTENGETKHTPFNSESLIALKGRLKNRDYNYIETEFHKGLQKSL